MIDPELESIILQKPVLWVGAGLSVAAGYPSTDAILSALRAAAPRPLLKREFTEVVDEFIAATSRGDLVRVLQRLFQTPHDPTPTHDAIARLADARHFAAIVTTNYDDLLERAFAAAHVPLLVQTLESNASLREDDGALRLYKLHGAQTDWQRIILSGRSYADFEERYKFLDSQLQILLRQNPLLFSGCSLQDPRVLQWIESRPPEWLEDLMRWRALIRPSAWTAAQNMTWKGDKAGAVLTRTPLKAIHYESHADLQTVWLELARRLAPLAVGELVFDLQPGEDEWRCVGPTPESAPHTVANPMRDVEFLRDLRRLRPLLHRSVQVNQPEAAAQIAEARHVARSVGVRLTATLLSPSAREAVRRRFAEVDRGTARLTLRVAEGAIADAALALPWELLMPENGRFAVEESKLDLVRDAIKPGAPSLAVPSTTLSVAATIAAPDDQNALQYEDESYRMLKALAPLGQAVQFAELGELDDLVKLIDRTDAVVVHFSGHGLPGRLVFENELGLTKQVPVTELTAKLRQHVQPSGVAKPFPRLFYLASCHGASATLTPPGGSEPDARTLRAELSTALGEGPSTAATLHREGFACVLGYFGPIGDTVSTSAEVALYTALSEGRTILHSVKQARAALSEPHTHADQSYHYPLGWAQFVAYLRGPDRPLTARPQSSPSTVTPVSRLPREEVKVSGLPVLEYGFIGRRGLQHEVRRRLKAGQRLLVLQGLGGLGKTALASQILCNVLTRERADQLIIRVGEFADITLLRRQAEEHGNTHGLVGWSNEVIRLHERYPDPVEGFEQTVLALHAHRPGVVLYADNMESLQVGPGGTSELEPGALGTWRPDAERWWAAMETLSKHIIVLASTRYLWMGLDPNALLALDRMSRADLWRMLDTFPTLARLPWSAREKVADTADGRPRTLERLDGLLREAHRDPTRTITDAWTEWVAPVLAQHGARLTEDLLLAELWRCISQDARDQAIAASVLGQPAPRRVLDALGPAAGELIGAGLLTRHRELTPECGGKSPQLAWEDRWSMHTSVREFAFAQGTSDVLGRARTRAANEYAVIVAEPGANWSDQIEAIDLYLANGDSTDAWPLASEYSFWLRRHGQFAVAIHFLERFTHLGLHGDACFEHATQLAQLRSVSGIHDDRIESELRQSVDAAPSVTLKAAALHLLANHVIGQGRNDEAEQLFKIALSTIESSLGRNHSLYSGTLNNMAYMFGIQGEYAKAEGILREVLSIAEGTIGRKHPDFGTALNNFASMLAEQGKNEEAEPLLRESLIIRKKTLEPTHPDYNTSVYMLARVLTQQAKYYEAEQLIRDALDMAERIYGYNHKECGTCLHKLAEVLAEQAKFPEAERCLRNALVVSETALGEHSDQIVILHSLANITREQNKPDEAERLLRKSLMLIERFFGCENFSYIESLRSLASVRSQQGNLRDAESSLREALTLTEKTLGTGHADYSATLDHLAALLAEQSKYHEAEVLLREALALRAKTLGEDHPTLCSLLLNLAVVIIPQGRTEESFHFLERAQEIGHLALGEEHPVVKQIQGFLEQLMRFRAR